MTHDLQRILESKRVFAGRSRAARSRRNCACLTPFVTGYARFARRPSDAEAVPPTKDKRRFPQGGNRYTLSAARGRRRERLPVAELDAVPLQPGDRRAVSVECGFAENWIVTAAVEGDEELAVGTDFDEAAGFDELAIELLGLGLLEIS